MGVNISWNFICKSQNNKFRSNLQTNPPPTLAVITQARKRQKRLREAVEPQPTTFDFMVEQIPRIHLQPPALEHPYPDQPNLGPVQQAPAVRGVELPRLVLPITPQPPGLPFDAGIVPQAVAEILTRTGLAFDQFERQAGFCDRLEGFFVHERLIASFPRDEVEQATVHVAKHETYEVVVGFGFRLDEEGSVEV